MSDKSEDQKAWTVEYLRTRSGNTPYRTFLDSLSRYQQAVLDISVHHVLATWGLGVCASEWGKPLGRNLYEFRIRRELKTICNEIGIDAPADIANEKKVLLRVFFSVYGNRIVLLLGGYDKASNPSPRRQAKEIKHARILLAEFQRIQRSARQREH